MEIFPSICFDYYECLDAGEFERHEEFDGEKSDGEISEEESDDNNDEGESEDWDDNDDSDSLSDDEYQDWDDSDYQGPLNNDEDDESRYYSPRDSGGYSVYAIGEDNPMIDRTDAIQSTLTIHIKGDEPASDSKDSEGYEITLKGKQTL
ncbi:phosphopantothenoylcysteine decarboxylase subunit VHS3-like [Macadamia integrifolia]|uniref:phosphopantothenoylcysteine decarboxylase subunit VHS3-like n=1 Tax=Macadamia integrifolia TaxID=60698 RepID=UPI001C4F65BB|nr:phosphopantothenoylcysteine decarboxylase subunit VHS3-like [Macadamia integrifolia]